MAVGEQKVNIQFVALGQAFFQWVTFCLRNWLFIYEVSRGNFFSNANMGIYSSVLISFLG